MKIKFFNLFLVVLALLANSCLTQKKIELLQDTRDMNNYTLKELKERKIKPYDELYIRVSSFDEVAFNFFGNQMETRSSGGMSEQAISLLSYEVNKDGNIYFPIIGEVNIESLTLLEATEKLKKLLRDYFNQPTVLIKFVNTKVSVLGEVNNPGSYVYTKPDLNINQAIALAGGINKLGNRNQVTLMREYEGKVRTVHLNLTKSGYLTSDYYYIQPDDVIYVRPLRASKISTNQLTYSLLLSSITTSILILNYVKK